MEISPDVIIAASKLKQGAVTSILQQAYPQIYRLAMALSGREDVARGIVRFVAARSLRVMPKWTEDTDPRAWFWRFTILTSRRAAKHPPDPRRDSLLGDGSDPQQVAFMIALRNLPHQQQEAFILDHAEKATTRVAATAMDCSTLAMENHLKAANETMQLVGGERFYELTAMLTARYAALLPDEDLIIPRVQSMVGRYIWPRRIIRVAGWIMLLALLIGGVWLVRKLMHVLEF